MSGSKKNILFIVNDLNFFISHRLPIAKEAHDNGFNITIASNLINDKNSVAGLPFKFCHLPIHRSSLNIFKEILLFFSIFNLIKKLSPEIVHAITIKPVIYSGIVARILKTKIVVSSISGLGFTFHSDFNFLSLLRLPIKFLYYLALKNKNQRIIFHNNHDKKLLQRFCKLEDKNCYLTYGSGVDLEIFDFTKVTPETSKYRVLMACRILKDKGVEEYCKAARMLNQEFDDIEFFLAGQIDSSNPSSFSLDEISKLCLDCDVNYLGFCKDMLHLYKTSKLAVLPSYGEGFPKFLIEAAAAGLPAVTTDVPGCKDAVEHLKTGIIVPVRNSVELASAIKLLKVNKSLYEQYAINAKNFAKKHFSIKDVILLHMQIYNEVFLK